MIYFTGDLHGEMERLRTSDIKKLKKNDTLIVCGDFGFIWDGSAEEEKRLKRLGKMKFQLLFVPGCHDNYALLKNYPTVDFCGGKARQISDRLYELLRGEVYTIEEKTIFAFGGGVGDDEHLREEGITWWTEETPTEEEYETAIANLASHQNKVDYIVTHDISSAVKQFINMDQDDNEIGKIHAFFNVLSKQTSFKAWFFGRYHMDKLIPPHYHALFRTTVKAPGQEQSKKAK